MPDRAAGRYLLTGETLDGPTAAAVGLLSECTSDLDAAIGQLLDALRASSPQGLAETKALTTAAMRAGFDAHADDLQQLSARLFASAEGREGMRAFREKRPPSWAAGSD